MSRDIIEKNSVWYDAAAALEELAQKKAKSAKFAFRLRRLMRLVLPVAQDIEETRSSIIEEHTAKDESGQPIQVGPNQVKLTDPSACTAKVKELMMQRVSLSIDPIRAEELEEEGIIPTPSLAYRLGPLLLEPAVSRDGVAEAARVEPAA